MDVVAPIIYASSRLFNRFPFPDFKQPLRERKLFYRWFADESQSRGFETKWPRAAEKAVDNLEMLFWPGTSALGTSNSRIENYVLKGNKLIFETVFPKLAALHNGSTLRGDAARSWDAQALFDEQNLIQPLYGTLTVGDQKILKRDIGLNMTLKPLVGELNDPAARWDFGMRNVGYKATFAEYIWLIYKAR